MSKHTPHFSSHVPHAAVSPESPTAAQLRSARALSDADIAKRAYQKYEARGRTHGYDREDWIAASHELIAETFGHQGLSPCRALSALPDDSEFPET